MNETFNVKKILDSIKNYNSFLSINELDKRAFEISKKYGFKIEKIGESNEKHPIYMISCGKGKKNALLYGFPHPDEPIGSLTIDFLLEYFGKNPLELEETGFRWNFIYSIDPDGTKLNQGWFKGKLNFKKYIYNYYRPSDDRMIDWAFPVKYKDYEWKTPLKETKILIKIINQLMPDLMYPLHNCDFGGAYFFLSREFDKEYYENIINWVKLLRIPLHFGEPEEPFLKEIKKPFYFDFGIKDYYEYFLKTGENLSEKLDCGDSGSQYLLNKKPSSMVITGEIPYFFSKEASNQALSGKSRREIWLEKIELLDEMNKFYLKFIPKILDSMDRKNPFYYVFKSVEGEIESGNENLKNYIINSQEYDRKATSSEVFDCDIVNKFQICLILGELRRASRIVRLSEREISEIEAKIKKFIKIMNKKTELLIFPIKKLIQLQVLLLFESLNSFKKGF